MSGSPMIVRPAAPASPPGSMLAGDGWWPDIDCTDMREALRIGEVVTQARLMAALESAWLTATGDLDAWQARQQAAGHATLGDVSPKMVNGKPRLAVLFTNAVRYGAAAELAEFSTDISATATNETRADAKLAIGCHYERLRLMAVRDMIGTTRVAVELI